MVETHPSSTDQLQLVNSLDYIEKGNNFAELERLVGNYRMLWRWPTEPFEQGVFGMYTLLQDEVTADHFCTELKDGFGFALEHFWYRLFLQLCVVQEDAEYEMLKRVAPNLMIISSGDHDHGGTPVHTADVIEHTPEEKWRVSVLNAGWMFQKKFPKGTRIITKSFW